MLDTYMVSWTGQPIPAAEQFVMRRVAVQMRTSLSATEVEFVHVLCEGIVRFVGTGVYGALGGLHFFGDLGKKNNKENTANFFIPRNVLRRKADEGIMIQQSFAIRGESVTPNGYPNDIDVETASGAGKLKIKVRKEA